MDWKGRWDAFDTFAQDVTRENRVPGVMIGANLEGAKLYRNGFGYRDIDARLALTDDTMMGTGSVTKSVTAVAIMLLQEESKLSVHDPVVTYLPEFRTPDRLHTGQITIHHFMTHTSGLPPLPLEYLSAKWGIPTDFTAEDHPIHKIPKADRKPLNTYGELMELIGTLDYQLLGPPGTEFSYSNEAYSLLGAIIERVSGQPYDVFVTKRILQPVGMDSSTFRVADIKHRPDVTTVYHRRGNGSEGELYADPQWEESTVGMANGYLYSTVSDMLKFAEIFRTGGMVGNERILSEESVAQMTACHVTCDLDTFYGYGLEITPDYYGTRLVEHGGSCKGVSAHLAILPERGITAVGLANIVGAPTSRLIHALLNDVQGRAVDSDHCPAYETHQVTEETMQQYIGRYHSDEGADLRVELDGDTLTLEVRGFVCRLRPIADDYFLADVLGRRLNLGFVRNDMGHVVRARFGFRQFHKVK